MNKKNIFKNCVLQQSSLYLIAVLLLLIMMGGCGDANGGATTDDNVSNGSVDGTGNDIDEDNESVENESTEEYLPAGEKHGNISVSEDGKTIYVHGWVYVYELSDRRTKKAKKIVFCKDAGIIVDWDSDFAYVPCLQEAPLVEEIEVEEGNSTLYEVDGMLVKKAGTDKYAEDEMLVFCVPGKKGEVRIPEGVQIIGDCAFLGCAGVTSVFLPVSVEALRGAVFGDMKSCTNIQVDKNNKVYYSQNGVLYNKGSNDFSRVSAYPAGKKDGVYDAAPEYIEEIGTGAFLGAKHLKEVYLPSKVRVIHSAAFQGCEQLEKVIVKNKKRISVEGNAFDDCPRLKEHVKDKDDL